MNYKRLEIYVGWTCNQKCSYCMEYPNMEEVWDKKVSKYDILKKLIKYKKKGYNHVTYLGGEPFIQAVFLDALIIGKKLLYTILVTTNCTTLHLDSQASKFLPYIDELILSVEAIDKELQQEISRTKVYVKWDKVFENIKKYWNGKYLKANIVIIKDNLSELDSIVKYLNINGIKNIAITYPDIDLGYYGREHTINKVAPLYSECVTKIIDIVDYCKKNNINLKLADFPFCVFPKHNINNYIELTDDYDYETRIKIDHFECIIDRGELNNSNEIPRERIWCTKCNGCKYKGKCWGASIDYGEIYGYDEINPII
ncbi:MAG: radical SAM protein [Candidatus Gracilibacteria bacterium]